MNIGVCFIGYSPMHQGHLDLIMKSKKLNDLTYVIVCGARLNFELVEGATESNVKLELF